MGSLVTHVCSGVSGEVDVALELLCELVSQKPMEMTQYAVFVKVVTAICIFDRSCILLIQSQRNTGPL